jgi:lipoprotein signal peptidase
MAERSYRRVLWTLVVLGTCLDQSGKYGVFRWLYQHPRFYQEIKYEGRPIGGTGEYTIIPGVFKLHVQFTDKAAQEGHWLTPLRTWSADVLPTVNPGALFGWGKEYPELANPLFSIISVVAAVAIIYWGTRRSTARDLALCAALGLILAGTLGNLYDRLVFHGVRDFLYFHWFEWPVFNIADSCLVCGAFLLLGQAFFYRPAQVAQENAGMTLTPAGELK